MNEPRDLEHTLWNSADIGQGRLPADSNSEDYRIQYDVHRLLTRTVSTRGEPKVSPGFELALERRLGAGAPRPPAQRVHALMRLYWWSLVIAAGLSTWCFVVTLPARHGPWVVPLMLALVPLSLFSVSLVDRIPGALGIARPMPLRDL